MHNKTVAKAAVMPISSNTSSSITWVSSLEKAISNEELNRWLLYFQVTARHSVPTKKSIHPLMAALHFLLALFQVRNPSLKLISFFF